MTTQQLVAPTVIEGDCPACHGTFPVVAVLLTSGVALQVPEHARVDRTRPRRCPCSGWLARESRVQRYFYVEGVHFL